MLAVTSICGRCGREFRWEAREYQVLGLKNPPRVCPECADKQQDRPDVTVSRKVLFETVCRVESLPPVKWEKFAGMEGDLPCWRATIKGKTFGAAWLGRIDFFAVGFPTESEDLSRYLIGQVVELADMEVIKKVGKRRWERQTLMHGVVGGYATIPIQEAEAALQAEPNSTEYKIVEEVRRYVRLMPSEEDPEDRLLVWATARTKTTLKGLGRQYHAHFEGSPLWQREIRGGYRSGRAYTTGILAVVAPDAPLIKVFREGGATEMTRWPSDEAAE